MPSAPAPAANFPWKPLRSLFNPRLILFLDGQLGDHLSGFAQARVDRGFDPVTQGTRLRLDEFALRYSPWDDGRLNVQLGQFATVIGNWVARHDAKDNPFITAPLPYELLTGIYDEEASFTPKEFIAFDLDEKIKYNPIIWGPSYASGLAVTGRLGRFDYAIEVKNAGPSSRPEAWSVQHLGFGRPSYSARVGFRPDLRWNVGVSVSDSAYFLPFATPSLPPGTSRHDYCEQVLAHDLSFAWRHLQVWAEIFYARFDVPYVGEASTVSGYVETKYKFTPQLYGALRWNRQVFSTIDNGLGVQTHWTKALWRTEAATGYRFTPKTELKLQASAQHEALQKQRLSMNYALQLNVRF